MKGNKLLVSFPLMNVFILSSHKPKVSKIEKSQINPWLLNKHYAHTIPAVIYQFGLFLDNMLEGVCCFGSPACPSNNNMGDFKQIELVRLVVNEGLGKNVLSHFVGSSLKLLPKPLSVVSYADSKMGHHGYIYQATNWIYTGLGDPVPNWIDKDGNSIHNRTFTELRKKHPEYSLMEIANKIGAEKVIGSSKHRYFYFLGDKRQKRIWYNELKDRFQILPYPKGENKRYKIEKDNEKVTSLLKW